MYFAINLFSYLLSLVPLKLLPAIAHSFAFLSFSVLRLRRKLMFQNLTRAFPEMDHAERRRVAYLSVYNFILTSLEFLHFRDGSIGDQTEIIGVEHAQNALQKGKGLYVLCMHLGNWEAMGAAVSRQIAPVHIVLKKVGSPSIDRFVSELRAKNRFYAIPRQKKGDAYRGIQKNLASGHIVGFVMDQAKGSCPRLPFFGTPATTNTSLAAFWRKNPAPILLGYSYRISVGQHRVHISPEFDLQSSDNIEDDTLKNSLYFNQRLEDCIREHKEQYFWLHDRWK
ncbi:MAG: lysophospholipid acyltransferase family protein [Oligoflexales bacterium]|nr:lysophospholipid acyltransferase family protein [Oligoflexales bacterium]